jgi:hypothetical protein
MRDSLHVTELPHPQFEPKSGVHSKNNPQSFHPFEEAFFSSNREVALHLVPHLRSGGGAGIAIRISVLSEGLTVVPHRGGPAAVQPTAQVF